MSNDVCKTEDLLEAITNVSHAWVKLLKYLLSTGAPLPGTSGNMLKTDNIVKDRNYVLLEAFKTILSRVSSFYKCPC